MKKMKLTKMCGFVALSLGVWLNSSVMLSNVGAASPFSIESDVGVQMSPGGIVGGAWKRDKYNVLPSDPSKYILATSLPGTSGTSSLSGPVLDRLPIFDFGKVYISGADEVYYSAMNRVLYSSVAELITDLSETSRADISSYVQVSDLSGQNSGWELTVSGSGLKGSGNMLDTAEIKGAKLQLSGTQAKSLTDSRYRPSILNKNITVNSQNSLVAAAMPREGMGTWAITFGDEHVEKESDRAPKEKSNYAVLSIPGASKKSAGQYFMELTWTLSNTPTSS
ncbi:WxL domain-containing protein [Listeria kieliensis]